jgi:hypothetical protein
MQILCLIAAANTPPSKASFGNLDRGIKQREIEGPDSWMTGAQHTGRALGQLRTTCQFPMHSTTTGRTRRPTD